LTRPFQTENYSIENIGRDWYKAAAPFSSRRS
jgi:hypothetical protein